MALLDDRDVFDVLTQFDATLKELEARLGADFGLLESALARQFGKIIREELRRLDELVQERLRELATQIFQLDQLQAAQGRLLEENENENFTAGSERRSRAQQIAEWGEIIRRMQREF